MGHKYEKYDCGKTIGKKGGTSWDLLGLSNYLW